MPATVWTLSNFLSLSRIVLLLPFAIFLLSETPGDRTWAALIALVAVATDYFDGAVARARHEVTEIGKIIDPVADKIVVGTAVILLVITGDLAGWVAAVIVLRDLLIVAGSLLIRRRKKIVVQSNWPGKVAVGAFAVLIILGVLRPEGWEWFRTATLWFSLAMVVLSTVMYAQRLFIGPTDR
ncbi:MAG: CDP-alcohol phosphatidyltransferase family protein [Bacteroidetes bacterium]|jgi:CDP-diacylglycerol--glycerol-3-phosphate 3-phosphatidyltransferase|nr:CDP-alcohol phosphatidyltransferase family protein [Bacteroidota bacterium]